MNCPKCIDNRFYYIQRVYECHTIDHVDDNGELLLMGLNDSMVDNNHSPYVYCEGCGRTFDLKLNEVERQEEQYMSVDIGSENED